MTQSHTDNNRKSYRDRNERFSSQSKIGGRPQSHTDNNRTSYRDRNERFSSQSKIGVGVTQSHTNNNRKSYRDRNERFSSQSKIGGRPNLIVVIKGKVTGIEIKVWIKPQNRWVTSCCTDNVRKSYRDQNEKFGPNLKIGG